MEEDEEDYGALIYRESQLRRAEAAAAAAAVRNAKKKKDLSAAALPTKEEELVRKRALWRKAKQSRAFQLIGAQI